MPLGDKNKIIPGCGAHHVTIQTRNWEDALHLYRDVLGMTPVAEFGPTERRMMLLERSTCARPATRSPSNRRTLTSTDLV